MSIQLIAQYYNAIDKTILYGRSNNETAVHTAFYNLLNQYCERKDLLLVQELDYLTPAKKKVRPDGTVKDVLRLDWGYWESRK
jgi:predicted TPR repeat methyltransferase